MCRTRTSFSNTHELSERSGFRQALYSCKVNTHVTRNTHLVVLFKTLPVSVPLASAGVVHLANAVVLVTWTYEATHRSCAQRVTRRPSFRQCSGSRFSLLHNIKSSLYSLQKEPRKKAIDLSGADDTPTSSTAGTSFDIPMGSTYENVALFASRCVAISPS